MALKLVKIVGLVLAVSCWMWARMGIRSDASTVVVIWCAPLLVYPISLLARKALDAKPVPERAQWANVLTHYAMMAALGVGIFSAIRLVGARPGALFVFPRELAYVLLVVTGVITSLTVVNLAWRGLGAPFALKLSSRLATDWMYRWTRNPMLLSFLAFLLSAGLWYRSVWFLIWIAVIISPAWIFFERVYEERELEIRFGSSYRDYRARTPFLWPGRPKVPGSWTDPPTRRVPV